MGKSTLSLCMIVKNEEDMLGKCLKSVKGIVDEIIVVDTGSTDTTKEIAHAYGAKVYDYAWNYDFAAARNFAIEQATSEWILQLDADEYLVPNSGERLKQYIDDTFEAALTVQIHNYDDKNGSYSVNNYPRVYRNNRTIAYVGKIHEQVMDAGSPVIAQETDVQLIHLGYTEDVVNKKKKTYRNMRILREQLRENPNDSFANYNLGKELMKTKEYAKALKCFKVAHKLSENHAIKTSSVIQLVKVLVQLNQMDQAIGVLEEAKQVYTDYTDLWYYEGEVLERLGREADAKESYQACLRMGEAPSHYMRTNGVAHLFPLERLAALAMMDRNFEQALGYLTEITEASKFNFHQVTKVIGTLLRMFDMEKVIEFINEMYSNADAEEAVFKCRLANHFRLYEAFDELLASRSALGMPKEEKEVVDFYRLIGQPQAKALALDWAKDKNRRHFSLIYAAITKDEDVLMAVKEDKTATLILQYIEKQRVEKPKGKYNNSLYIETIRELMKLRNYEYVEYLVPVCDAFHPDVYAALGEVFYEHHQDDFAIQYFSTYLLQHPNDFDIQLKASRLLLAQQQYEEAVMLAQKANKLNEHHFKPIEVMIDALLALGERAAVMEISQQVLQKYPNSTYLKSKAAPF